MQNSINIIEKDIQLQDDYVKSRLSYIFISGASFNFLSLKPPDLPETNYSFDACILAHTEEVIFKNVDNPGVYTHMSFEAFSDIIQQSFHQTLLIEVKPFHQALVLVESIFYFKSVFNDTDIYVAHKNENIQLLYTKLQQLLTQERQFLSQILSFANALQEDNLLQFPIVKPQLLDENLNLSRPKRGFQEAFSGLLTGYSISDMAGVAQTNYRKMNLNFKHAKMFEDKLRLTQNKLAQHFGELSRLQQKEIQMQFYLEIEHYLSMAYEHTMMQLDTIVETNDLPATIIAVFHLIRHLEYCDQFYCLVHPVFKLRNDTLITTVQLQNLHLVQAVYISCTLVGISRTSKYSNQIAHVQDDNLVFKNINLPQIRSDFLQDAKINAATRPITATDLIGGIIFPVYKGPSVALLCIETKLIVVDNKNMNCDSSTLHFIPMPFSIVVDGIPILETILSHYLARHISITMDDFSYDNTMFVPRKNSTRAIENKLVTFFATANSLHYTIFGTGTLVIFLTFSVLCICCYFKFPGVFNSLLCCFNPTCFLRRMASAKHDLMSRLIPPEQQGTEMGNVNAAGQSNDSPARSQSSSVVKPGDSCKRKIPTCNCSIIEGEKCKAIKHQKAVPPTILEHSNA